PVEIAEHVYRVEAVTLRGLERQLAAGDARRDVGPHSRAGVVLLLAAMRSPKQLEMPGGARGIAPEGMGYEAVRAAWAELPARWDAAVASFPEALERTPLLRHPAAGALTLETPPASSPPTRPGTAASSPARPAAGGRRGGRRTFRPPTFYRLDGLVAPPCPYASPRPPLPRASDRLGGLPLPAGGADGGSTAGPLLAGRPQLPRRRRLGAERVLQPARGGRADGPHRRR